MSSNLFSIHNPVPQTTYLDWAFLAFGRNKYWRPMPGHRSEGIIVWFIQSHIGALGAISLRLAWFWFLDFQCQGRELPSREELRMPAFSLFETAGGVKHTST